MTLQTGMTLLLMLFRMLSLVIALKQPWIFVPSLVFLSLPFLLGLLLLHCPPPLLLLHYPLQCLYFLLLRFVLKGGSPSPTSQRPWVSVLHRHKFHLFVQAHLPVSPLVPLLHLRVCLRNHTPTILLPKLRLCLLCDALLVCKQRHHLHLPSDLHQRYVGLDVFSLYYQQPIFSPFL